MSHFTHEASARRMSVRLLLASGVIGPLLFIAAFLVEGATRPGYNALRDAVSSLSRGPMGWTQIASFIVCGVLLVCYAFGLRTVLRQGRGSVWGPILHGVAGLGLIGAGIFVTDTAPTISTVHGALHNLFSLLVFVQRCAIVLGWSWMALLAITLLRKEAGRK